MIIACVIALILSVVVIISIFSKSDNSNDTDSQYYIDGYHIYYDRKIIRHMNKNSNH